MVLLLSMLTTIHQPSMATYTGPITPTTISFNETITTTSHYYHSRFVQVATPAPTVASVPACGAIVQFSNNNQQPQKCPGVSGNPIASNVVGTSYASVPPYGKIADATIVLNAALPGVITSVFVALTTTNPLILTDVAAGPPSPPDTSFTPSRVFYCF